MKIGITVWGDIISPVFDAARSLMVAEVRNGRIVSTERLPIRAGFPMQQVNSLKFYGIDVLICGAVSEIPANMIEAAGIRLIPFIKGNVNEVLHAFINNQLPAAHFMMPGCGKRRRRRQRGRNRR
ncbi:MAG: NifB/NifX family molybdenum-iron cluster-binding protein [Desulfosalsimonadaceae bacterium]